MSTETIYEYKGQGVKSGLEACFGPGVPVSCCITELYYTDVARTPNPLGRGYWLAAAGQDKTLL